MKYYRLAIPSEHESQVRGMLELGRQMRPGLVDEVFLKFLDEDDLSDEEIDAGVSLVLFADEPTYQLAQQFGFSGAEEVATIPKKAQEYYEQS